MTGLLVAMVTVGCLLSRQRWDVRTFQRRQEAGWGETGTRRLWLVTAAGRSGTWLVMDRCGLESTETAQVRITSTCFERILLNRLFWKSIDSSKRKKQSMLRQRSGNSRTMYWAATTESLYEFSVLKHLFLLLYFRSQLSHEMRCRLWIKTILQDQQNQLTQKEAKQQQVRTRQVREMRNFTSNVM